MPDIFSYEFTGVEDALSMFDGRLIVGPALRTSLSKAGNDARVTASGDIRDEYNIPAYRINEYLTSQIYLGEEVATVTITGRGRGLALSYFDVKQEGRVIVKTGKGKSRRSHLGYRYGRGYPGPVSVRVRLDTGRQIVLPEGSQYGTKAFLAMTKSGHLGVFVRTGKKHLPIEQKFGPGVGGLFGTPKVMDHAKAIAIATFTTEFPRQINLLLAGRRR
jgi:hypothetical protein